MQETLEHSTKIAFKQNNFLSLKDADERLDFEEHLGSISTGVLRTLSFSHPPLDFFFLFFILHWLFLAIVTWGCLGSKRSHFPPGVGVAGSLCVSPRGGGFPSSDTKLSLDL